MIKKSLLPIFISVVLVSCSPQNLQNTDYKIKSVTTTANSSSSPVDYRKVSLPIPNPQSSILPTINTQNVVADEKIEFKKESLNYPNKESFAPGLISVIYKNSYKIRTKKQSNEIDSNETNITKEINVKLNNYKIKKSTTLLPNNADLGSLKKIQIDLSNNFKIDFPDLGSIHFYEFPANSDTIKIAEELRKLPYVETAYPTSLATTTSTPAPTFLARQGLNDIHKNMPSPYEPYFSSFSEQYWSWFNHHKIFQAWDIYRQNFGNVSDISYVAQSDLPVIAVIDDGFYKGTDADAPTYLTGAHIDVNGININSDTSKHTQYNSNNPTLQDSHGTSMANIIASPKNNGIGFCGVIPNARIYPVKLDFAYNSSTNKYAFTSTSIAAGINNASDNINVDVINASLGLLISAPISYDPIINVAIKYAIGKGKPVVISAGNDKNNLDNLVTPDNWGAVTVGGSSSYNGQIWDSAVSGGSGGSNYGLTVSLAAQAEEMYAPTWRVSTNSLSLAGSNTGTSPATAEVSAILGMMKRLAKKKNVSYTPQELRDVVSYTGTLGVSSLPSNSNPSNFPAPAISSKKFLGKGLANTDNNINLYAEMRDLNAWAALTVINNSNYPKVTRIFNNDDYTWGTTNNDWNNRYASENYFDESFWGFASPLPSGTSLNFFTGNSGGYGALGYQTYKYGKFENERIYGVLTRYNTSNTNQTVYYQTLGSPNTSWFGSMGWNY